MLSSYVAPVNIEAPAMSHIAAFHALFALTAVGIGVMVLARRKGTPSHKLWGRVWVTLMAAVALSSFWIFDIRHGAGPSLIHLLSLLTLVSLGLAARFIR